MTKSEELLALADALGGEEIVFEGQRRYAAGIEDVDAAAAALREYAGMLNAEPVSQTVPDNDCVICPGCAHQFRAIPVNVQAQLRRQREQLEAPTTQEPVAWMNVKYGTFFGAGVIAATDRNDDLIASGELVRLYTHPPAPTTPLTDADLWRIWNCAVGVPNHETFKGCCRAVLAAQEAKK